LIKIRSLFRLEGAADFFFRRAAHFSEKDIVKWFEILYNKKV